MAERIRHFEERSVEPVYTRSTWTAAGVVNYILSVVEILLTMRLLFLLFGANASNSFVNFIYQLTSPLVAPFRGIFANPEEGLGVFDWATAVSMIVYAILAYAIIRLFFVGDPEYVDEP